MAPKGHCKTEKNNGVKSKHCICPLFKRGFPVNFHPHTYGKDQLKILWQERLLGYFTDTF